MTAAVGPQLKQGSAGATGPRLPVAGVLSDRLSEAACQMRRAPAHLAADLLGLGLASAVFRSIEDSEVWWWALLASLPLWLLRAWVTCGVATHSVPTAGRLLQWQRRHVFLVVAQGFPLGLCCAVFQPLATGMQQATLLVVVFITMLAAVPALALQPRHLALQAGLTAGPMALAVMVDTHDPDHFHLLGTMVLMLALVLWIGESFRSAVERASGLKDKAHALRRELSQQAAGAEMAFHRAEAAVQAHRQLLAAASHDLRQPLMALQHYGYQMRQRLTAPGDAQVLQGFELCHAALEQMFGDLLDLSRMECGRTPPKRQAIPMEALYSRLAAQLGPTAFDRGLMLHWRGGHQVILGDPDMIERCLRNLILNALNHTQDGGIVVAARVHGSDVRLQVWDSGPGVAPEVQQRLFDDYFQADTPRRPDLPPSDRGCGLGLSIVRRLAHLMGGEVLLRSLPGRGSMFEVRLPMQAPPT